jgi:hypothetical protein
MKRIIRVFPQRTSYTPMDDYTYIGRPPFSQIIPERCEDTEDVCDYLSWIGGYDGEM